MMMTARRAGRVLMEAGATATTTGRVTKAKGQGCDEVGLWREIVVQTNLRHGAMFGFGRTKTGLGVCRPISTQQSECATMACRAHLKRTTEGQPKDNRRITEGQPKDNRRTTEGQPKD